MAFQEKSIWISLVITVLTFGFYFVQAIIVLTNSEIPDETLIGLFIGVISLIVIVQVILQSVLAVANRREAEKGEDERDKLIELKATRISYFILASGILVTCTSILTINSPLIIANLLLFFFIVAETAGYIKQLLYYRRGV